MLIGLEEYNYQYCIHFMQWQTLQFHWLTGVRFEHWLHRLWALIELISMTNENHSSIYNKPISIQDTKYDFFPFLLPFKFLKMGENREFENLELIT